MLKTKIELTLSISVVVLGFILLSCESNDNSQPQVPEVPTIPICEPSEAVVCTPEDTECTPKDAVVCEVSDSLSELKDSTGR